MPEATAAKRRAPVQPMRYSREFSVNFSAVSVSLSGYKYPLPPPTFDLFFSFLLQLSLPLWLRSSVVSVLFSLISESILRNTTLIILIFEIRDRSSVLAHG